MLGFLGHRRVSTTMYLGQLVLPMCEPSVPLLLNPFRSGQDGRNFLMLEWHLLGKTSAQ